MLCLCSPANKLPLTKQEGQPNIFFCSTCGSFGASSSHSFTSASDDFSHVIFGRVANTPPHSKQFVALSNPTRVFLRLFPVAQKVERLFAFVQPGKTGDRAANIQQPLFMTRIFEFPGLIEHFPGLRHRSL